MKNIEQVLKQNVYILIYKYVIPLPRKTQINGSEDKISNIPDTSLSRAHSMSAEIMKIQQNKNNNTMSLSGNFDAVEEANSEEEEEKLVQKETYTKEGEQKITEIEYILANLEDITFDDYKDLECIKSLSRVVDLKDGINTPELKNYLSNTLEMQK